MSGVIGQSSSRVYALTKSQDTAKVWIHGASDGSINDSFGVSSVDDSTTGSGSTTMYIGNESITTSSDMRIKKNIVDTKSNGLEVVNKFRVVDFNWDDPTDQCINNKNARGTWTGFLAQEAVEVAPYSVNAPRPEGKEIDMESEDRWGMDYDQLVPILVKAIQELTVEVEKLKAK